MKAWKYLGAPSSPGQILTAKLTSAGADPDLVLSQARALDKVPVDQRGRLHGVAIAVKDIMDTKGL